MEMEAGISHYQGQAEVDLLPSNTEKMTIHPVQIAV